jgi:hypothetical protein
MEPRPTQRDEQRLREAASDDMLLIGEVMLARARSVGEQITERCRQVTGQSHPDNQAGDQKD